MVLWTFQDDSFLQSLMSEGAYRASWNSVYSVWMPAYHWMACTMEERCIPMDGHAPVWTWHSCGGHRRKPDEETLSALNGGHPWKGQLVTLNVPDALVLLSFYGIWNAFLDLCCATCLEDVRSEVGALPSRRMRAACEPLLRNAQRTGFADGEHVPLHDLKTRLFQTCSRFATRVPAVPPRRWWANYWDIQATVPFLRAEWLVVTEAREYPGYGG